MDRLSKIDTIVFDKTGTLTRGKPEVTDFHVIGDENPDDLLQMIAQAEMASEHHLGKTIVKHAKEKGLSLQNDYEYVDVVKGNGLRNLRCWPSIQHWKPSVNGDGRHQTNR